MEGPWRNNVPEVCLLGGGRPGSVWTCTDRHGTTVPKDNSRIMPYFSGQAVKPPAVSCEAELGGPKPCARL